MGKKKHYQKVKSNDQEVKQEVKPEMETVISEETTEIVEETEEVIEKPYKFRRLGAPDMFLMFTIISRIGINEFMACLEGDSFKKLVKAFTSQEEAEDDLYIMGAVAGSLEIANVIFRNLHKCEKEIYQILAQTSNMTIEEITAEGNAVRFVEMVIDFLKKDEFPDFIKVVSKSFR